MLFTYWKLVVVLVLADVTHGFCQLIKNMKYAVYDMYQTLLDIEYHGISALQCLTVARKQSCYFLSPSTFPHPPQKSLPDDHHIKKTTWQHS